MLDAPTTVIPTMPQPPPVFVDPSGRRRTRLRRIAYGVGLAGLAYTVMVGVSFAGGPVSPENVLPFVDTTQRPAAPALTEPSVEPSASPTGGRASSGTGGRRTERPTPTRPRATLSGSVTRSPSPSPSAARTSPGGRTPAPAQPSGPATEPPATPPVVELPLPLPWPGGGNLVRSALRPLLGG